MPRSSSKFPAGKCSERAEKAAARRRPRDVRKQLAGSLAIELGLQTLANALFDLAAARVFAAKILKEIRAKQSLENEALVGRERRETADSVGEKFAVLLKTGEGLCKRFAMADGRLHILHQVFEN